MGDAATRCLAAAEAYETAKLEDRETARKCRDQGLQLVPVVAETPGGWGSYAQKLFGEVAAATAAATGVSLSRATQDLYEGLGVALQRAQARAVLARFCASTPTCAQPAAIAVTSRSEAALQATRASSEAP